jgi:hypothetical protein
MSGDTGTPHTAIVTADSLAAAFQHFSITHVTASEFFRFITQAGYRGEGIEATEGQPAAARGVVIPVCMYVLTPSTKFHQLISLIFVLDDRQLLPSEVAHTTKDIRMTPAPILDPEVYRHHLKQAVSHPALPWWMEADERLKMIQYYKKQSRDLGVQYEGPEY